ncbi:Glycosyltransferase involved in cell wall bisynthesis [Pseudobutyrivibrio sp. UC1225]|uniref:glycosyltransferase family 2 protein n=1 Tax=Pseudobutyrivibrio sp. UC1225 TaxID=1798185 RepID=UPI0008E55370|nr:glycosyltransferase family 2 protein [Pseudobutyrivibrio sp. UC1225]SFN58489.1 Glycosyltransferase involved in cell wall bisynthesis [Pseudobutyrivibrio sp. UC1225]
MEYSVIIPVYNTEKYLKKCLCSVAQQSFRDYEIILVDDGSTDSSGEICDVFATEYEGVCQVIHKENGGLSSARNAGLDVAKGKWIVFVDSDDLISDIFFEQLEDAKSEYDAQMYTYNIRRIDVDGNIGSKLIFAIENHGIRFSKDTDLSDYICNVVSNYKEGWEACDRIYKKSIIDEYNIRFVDNKKVFAEDLCFTLEYMIHVRSIFKLCDMLYYYRITPGSLINQVAQETMLIKLYTLSEYIYEKCKLHNEPLVDDYKIFFENLINYHIKYKLTNLTDKELNKQLDYLKNSQYGKQWADIEIRGNDVDEQ